LAERCQIVLVNRHFKRPASGTAARAGVAGTAQDPGSGIGSVVVRVLDSHGGLRLGLEPNQRPGRPSVNWTRVLLLEVPADPTLPT
jgi:hypothetical protein